MIREKLLALRERRGALIAQAERQREELNVMVVRAEAATAWIDRARAVVSRARAHPLWIAAGVALFVALRPRKALKWLVTGVSLWRGWLNLRAGLEHAAAVQPVRGT